MNEETLNNEVDQVARELAATVPVTFNPKAWEKMEKILEESPVADRTRSWYRFNFFFFSLAALFVQLSGLYFLSESKGLQNHSGFPELRQQPVVDSADEVYYHESPKQPHFSPAGKQLQHPEKTHLPGNRTGEQDSVYTTPKQDTTGNEVFIFW